jgi:hypothetical protein
MKKTALALALISALLFSALAGTLLFGTVQAATNVYGILNSDTTWTKENSPYTLTGVVAVNNGVTLTIEAGVTVNLMDTYIQVNGTLIAIGSSNEQINFNGGKILFTAISNGWNQHTGSGSIIQNAILNCTLETTGTSPKIDSNVITGTLSIGGSSIISNNTIKKDLSVLGGSPVISNNVLMNSLISTYSLESSGLLPIISNNTMTGQGIKCYGGTGVGGYALIIGNSISGCDTAIFGGASIIQNNYIFGNALGIDTLNGTILNNTITNNVKGINIPRNMIYFFGWGEIPNTPTISYNNFYSNTNYAVYTTASNNINATYNWWGTTDTELISQQIFDYRKDFSIGNVTFVPFLAEPNPSASPVIPEFSYPAISVLFMIATLLITVICFKKRKR